MESTDDNLAQMNIKQPNSNQSGFGLNQLLFAIVVIGIALHYVGPSLKEATESTNKSVSETTQGVSDLFSRRF